MLEHTIAGNKIIEIVMPADITNKIATNAISQFDNFIANAKGQFRTPFNTDNPAPGPGYQWEEHSTPAITEYKNTINVIVNEIFKEQYEFQDSWFLLQTSDSWVKNREHQHLTGDIVVTLYVNVIEGESSIEFFQNNLQSSEKFYPKHGSVLIWPANTIHRPNPNISNYQRISLNSVMTKKVITSAVDTPLHAKRMNICKSCPRLNALNFCMECSCYMPLKTRIDSTKCPLEKW